MESDELVLKLAVRALLEVLKLSTKLHFYSIVIIDQDIRLSCIVLTTYSWVNVNFNLDHMGISHMPLLNFFFGGSKQVYI